MSRWAGIIAGTIVGALIIWPGIPIAKFYGPYLLVWVMNGGNP